MFFSKKNCYNLTRFSSNAMEFNRDHSGKSKERTMAKVVLITGASSGMGKASALYLAQKGYRVYAATRTPHKLDTYAHPNLFPLTFDITNRSSVQSGVDSIVKQEGGVDILVNNAGYGLLSTVEDVKEEQMQAQFDVNVFGLLRTTQAVISYMRHKRNGVIINISSFLGKIGLPLFTLYNASKYAVEGITDSLRYELSEFGIRVHSVLPGFFDTNFARDNLIINEATVSKDSAYARIVASLTPTITNQINNGNDPYSVAKLIDEIIQDPHFPARVTIGDKAKKFIPMRKELSDEDFERRVREYYDI